VLPEIRYNLKVAAQRLEISYNALNYKIRQIWPGANSFRKGIIGRLDLTTAASSTTGNLTNTNTSDDEKGDPTQTLTGDL
jgi:hypothetical protein